MYKDRWIKWVLEGLILVMIILTIKFINISNMSIRNKKQLVIKTTSKEDFISVKKYGYSDILECLQKSKNFVVKSINDMENEICNIEVSYDGDMKLLYTSLDYLNESENFLGINKISIDKDAKVTNISINFIKNK